MARLQFTREQAKAEATQRAEHFVAGLANGSGARLADAFADTSVPGSRSSKHPVAWVIVFTFDPPDGAVMDGGELLVSVDLESGVIAVRG
jgi:hypothetical protein